MAKMQRNLVPSNKRTLLLKGSKACLSLYIYYYRDSRIPCNYFILGTRVKQSKNTVPDFSYSTA